MMKRIIPFLIALVCVFSSAYADNVLDITATYYNSFASTIGIEKLPSYSETEEAGTIKRTYILSDIRIAYKSDGEKITEAYVACPIDGDLMQFLAVSTATAFSVLRDDFDASICGDIFFHIIQRKSGKAERSISYAQNYGYDVSLIGEDILAFILICVKR